MDIYTKYLIIILIVVSIVIAILIYLLYPILNDMFFPKDTFTNGSGYGFNKSLQKPNTLIPITYVSRSVDFNLLAFLSQLKVNNIIDPKAYVLTKTQKGIVDKTSQFLPNIIIFSGNTDMILKQDGEKIWPENVDKLIEKYDEYKKLKKDTEFINSRFKRYITTHSNETGHLNPINVLLKTMGYQKDDRVNRITYDFRFIEFDKIYDQFIEFVKKYQDSSTFSNKNNIIIAYDFGAVIANICIQKLKDDAENRYLLFTISKLLLICPTIGGVPMTLRDYFSGNGIIDPKYIYYWSSVLMSMPHKEFYEDPVLVYNSVGYKADNLKKLIKNNWFYNNNMVNKDDPEHKDFIKKLDEISKFQEMSFNNPLVNTIIISNNDNNTPICYNFENDLRSPPARYMGLNNNQHSNSDIHQNNTFEGLPVSGDEVLPYQTIDKLYKKWKGKGNNITLEIINNCNHFTILQTKELALIITSNLK